MSSRKIAFLCSSTSWGGLEMNVLRFALWMEEAGQQTSIWCVENSPLHTEVKKSDLDCFLIKKHKKYFDLKAANVLANAFDDHQIDVVWIRDTRDMAVCGMAKSATKRELKLVYQQAMQLGVKKKDFFHTLRFKRINLWVSPLQFLSDQVQQMTRFPKERNAVIPLALETDRFTKKKNKSELREKAGIPTDALVLGIIGRIDPLKGQGFLIRSHAELFKTHPNLHLVIVGEPTKDEGTDYYDTLIELTKTLNTAQAVHFLPFQSDVENAYALFDIFAMTSVGETFGMVTIEAMASGLAVVGTNTSGTPELLEHGHAGLLYEPNDETQFNASLKQLLTNPEMRAELGSIAQKSATQRFSHTKVVQRLLTAIGNLY